MEWFVAPCSERHLLCWHQGLHSLTTTVMTGKRLPHNSSESFLMLQQTYHAGLEWNSASLVNRQRKSSLNSFCSSFHTCCGPLTLTCTSRYLSGVFRVLVQVCPSVDKSWWHECRDSSNWSFKARYFIDNLWFLLSTCHTKNDETRGTRYYMKHASLSAKTTFDFSLEQDWLKSQYWNCCRIVPSKIFTQGHECCANSYNRLRAYLSHNHVNERGKQMKNKHMTNNTNDT